MTYNTAIVKKGIDGRFDKAYREIQRQPYLASINNLFVEAPSTGASEEYGWLGDVPGVQEWIGDKALKGLKDYDYTIKNKDWYAGFSIDRNELEDEKIRAILPRVDMLAQTVAKWPAELVIRLMAEGVVNLSYDGHPFFSAHGGAGNNLLTGQGVSLDQVQADITAARTTMMKMKSDEGRVMGLQMDTIVCPPEMEATFLRVAKRTGNEETYNPVASWIKEVIVVPELEDSNNWYGLCTGYPLKPFIFQKRKAPTKVLDNTEEKRNRKLNYSAEMRGNAGYGFWQMAIQVVNA